jgi:hypothetical protein
MTWEELINGGAIVLLLAFAGIVIRWLVRRLDACERRARREGEEP